MERWAPRKDIEEARAGSSDALDRLVAHIWPASYRLAVSALGDRSLAEDAAQEACVVVYRKLRTLRSVDAFDAWMYRIVMHEASRARRRLHVREEAGADVMLASDDALNLDVWSALARLPPALRDVTVLFYFDDLKTDEIAEVLRIAHATVRTRLTRARERLRGVLDAYRPESSDTVPDFPHADIQRRFDARRTHERMRTLAASVVILAVSMVGAANASRIAAGVRVWLSGGNVRVEVSSLREIRYPTPADVRDVAGRANFNVIFPVALDPGLRVKHVVLSPAEHATTVDLSYEDPATGARTGITLLAKSAFASGAIAPPALAKRAYYWNVGDEVVVMLKRVTSLREMQRIREAMSAAAPQSTLAYTEGLAAPLRVLGTPAALDRVERTLHPAPDAVLIGESVVAQIPGIASRDQALNDTRIADLRSIPVRNGMPDYAKAVVAFDIRQAIAPRGVRAIAAVLRAASARNDDILVEQPAAGAYRIALVPRGAGIVKRFSVDVRTLAVRAQTQR